MIALDQITEHLVKRQVNQHPSDPVRPFAGGSQGGWITVYIMLLLWFIILLMTPIARYLGRSKADRADHDTEANAVAGNHRGTGGWRNRLVDAGRAARDSYIILLGTVLINVAGHGVDSAVETLLWIVMGIQIVWFFMHLFFYNPFVDMILLLAFITLTIINFALAFRD